MANELHRLEELQLIKAKLFEQEEMEILKAMRSDDPKDILAAQKILKDIEQKEESGRASFLIDPNEHNSNNGYVNRPLSVSYESLRAMSKTHIIRLIINTRINQVASFCEPQKDKYSTGFVIKKRRGKNKELTKQDEMKIEAITDFILNCGDHNIFDFDDFDTFARKTINDSLTFDQMNFEVVRGKNGKPNEFHAVDSSTIRFADLSNVNYFKSHNIKELKGYYPKYIQVLFDKIEAWFYPWEMCMGIRNPQTDMKSNGYGLSELEILISTVTSILWADQYNRNFFHQGASPKGILKVNGTVKGQALKEFKQKWQATVSGVNNAWKTPVLPADKAEWINLQQSNKDMEWSEWTNFLIKISTGCYSIDPSEINFPMNNSGGGGSMFEKDNEAKIKYSKDKGLYPLLKHFQSRINKYIIHPLTGGEFDFAFVGLDSITIQDEIDMMVKKVGNYMTINEIRREVGLEEIGEEGDIVANSFYMQNLQMKQQEQMMAESNEVAEDEAGNGAEPTDVDYENEETENPFVKGIEDYLKTVR